MTPAENITFAIGIAIANVGLLAMILVVSSKIPASQCWPALAVVAGTGLVLGLLSPFRRLKR